MLRILRVEGQSLLPDYQPGDFVVMLTRSAHIREGDTVVFRHPRYGTLIKRVERLEPDGSLWVVGTHRHSVDSRTFGPVPRAAVMGRVLWRISRS